MTRVRPEIEAHAEHVERSRASKAATVKEAVKGDSTPPHRPDGADPPPRPVGPRILVSNIMPEALGLLLQAHREGRLLQRDELSGWLGSFGPYTGGDGANGTSG